MLDAATSMSEDWRAIPSACKNHALGGMRARAAGFCALSLSLCPSPGGKGTHADRLWSQDARKDAHARTHKTLSAAIRQSVVGMRAGASRKPTLAAGWWTLAARKWTCAALSGALSEIMAKLAEMALVLPSVVGVPELWSP